MSHMIRSKLSPCAGMAAAVMLLVGATGAAAQFGDGGWRPGKARAKAAHALQAKEVAKELGISDELTEKLVTTYVTERSGYEEGQARWAGPGWGEEAKKTEQSKLKITLKEFLNEEQAAKAVDSLGVYIDQWDPMVVVLASLNLAEDKLYEALRLVRLYVVKVDTALWVAFDARENGKKGYKRAGDARNEYRAELEAGLSKILSNEQLAEWTKSAPAGGGGF